MVLPVGASHKGYGSAGTRISPRYAPTRRRERKEKGGNAVRRPAHSSERVPLPAPTIVGRSSTPGRRRSCCVRSGDWFGKGRPEAFEAFDSAAAISRRVRSSATG